MIQSFNAAACSNQNSELKITKNQTKLEYTRTFAENTESKIETLKVLNYTHAFKKKYPMQIIR